MGRLIRRILFSACAFALAGFCLGMLTGPVWEARVTLALDSPAALRSLPGALASEGCAAYAIPGTDVLELVLRGPSPEEAQARLADAMDRLPTLLAYLDLDSGVETLASAARCLSRPDPVKYALGGGILGALAAALLLLPAPQPREPLNLGDILKAMGRRAKRFALPILLTVAVLTPGNVLRAKLTEHPQFQAVTLVRIGAYDPDTADGLAGAVLGLLESQLAGSGPDAIRVGGTNLFRLTFRASTEEEALSAAQDFPNQWPRLARHIPGEPELQILEGPSVSAASQFSLPRSALTGAGSALALWLALLTGEALRRKDALCPGG